MKNEEMVKKPYSLLVDSRARAVITGVKQVESFDDALVVLSTHGGRLTVTGSGLHVDSLQPEEEKMTVSGAIAGCVYEDGSGKRGHGFLKRALGR